MAGQGGEIGTGDLPVPAHRAQVGARIGKVIGPEPPSGDLVHPAQRALHLGGGVPDPHRVPGESTLHHRVRGDQVRVLQPVHPGLRRTVVLVVGDEQGDEDIGVDQVDAHSLSARKSLISSAVTGRPARSWGRPVTGLVPISSSAPECSSPRAVNSLIMADSDTPCAAAAREIRWWSAGGRSTVVRMMLD